MFSKMDSHLPNRGSQISIFRREEKARSLVFLLESIGFHLLTLNFFPRVVANVPKSSTPANVPIFPWICPTYLIIPAPDAPGIATFVPITSLIDRSSQRSKRKQRFHFKK